MFNGTFVSCALSYIIFVLIQKVKLMNLFCSDHLQIESHQPLDLMREAKFKNKITNHQFQFHVKYIQNKNVNHATFALIK